MKTKTIFSAIALITSFFLPTFSSAQNDSLANGYGAGSFEHRCLFSVSGGRVALTSAGQKDILILRYDSLGNLAWVRQAGGVSNDEGIDAAVDAAGNEYVIGYFSDTAAFGASTLISAGAEDAFLAKYDKNGNLLWVRQNGGKGHDVGRKITIDEHGNVCVTEFISGIVFFKGREVVKKPDGTVVAIYSPDGELLSIK